MRSIEFIYRAMFLLIMTLPHSLASSTIHLLAVDVEAAGAQLCWPLIAIEFCHSLYNIQTKKLTLLETKRFSARVTIDQIEPKCYHEYWQKNMSKFVELQRDAVSYQQVAEQVTLYLDAIMHKHPDIVVISDNVTFDIGRLNALLESCHREPIAYRPDNVYQMPIDLSSLARALALLENTENAWLSRDIVTEKLFSCSPKKLMNNAYAICWQYIMYMEKIHHYKKNKQEPIHILGVDIKAAGSQLCWPTVSVGFCHAFYDCFAQQIAFVDMKRFDIKVDLSQFEPKCYEELWQYRQETYCFLQQSAEPYDKASYAIANYIQDLLQQYPSITIVSDNLSFDIFRLNAILESVGYEPISYRPDQVYQTPVDLTELARTLAILQSTQDPWLTRDVNNSMLSLYSHVACPIKNERHLPEEAAAKACWKYAAYMQDLQKYKREYS